MLYTSDPTWNVPIPNAYLKGFIRLNIETLRGLIVEYNAPNALITYAMLYISDPTWNVPNAHLKGFIRLNSSPCASVF